MKFGNHFTCVSILFGIMYSSYMAQGIEFHKVGGDLANEDDWGSNTLSSIRDIGDKHSGGGLPENEWEGKDTAR